MKGARYELRDTSYQLQVASYAIPVYMFTCLRVYLSYSVCTCIPPAGTISKTIQ